MTFQKGFKQDWLSVYKTKFGAKKNLSKENFSYETCTLRRHFPDVITGVDCWNNFVVAYSGADVAIFLLDENDLESADNVFVMKVKMPSSVRTLRFIEKAWDSCFLIFILQDTSI